MTAKQMMDNVIRKFGFEDARTIRFCEFMECPNRTTYFTKYVYQILMSVDLDEES